MRLRNSLLKISPVRFIAASLLIAFVHMFPLALFSTAASSKAFAAGQVATPPASLGDYWTPAAADLVDKIVARAASPTAVSLTIRNSSTLPDDDVARVRRAIRSELRSRKIRLTSNKQGTVEVEVTLSEALTDFVWVAEIQNGDSREVAMVIVAKPPPEMLHPAADPLVVRKIRVYQQAVPLLDVVALPVTQIEPVTASAGEATPRLLVLSLGSVSLYEKAAQGDKPPQGDFEKPGWRLKASIPFALGHPWPRDVRARLAVRTSNQFEVYLPGGKCSGTVDPLEVQCQEGDEAWPLGPVGPGSALGTLAFFSADRNVFDGRIRWEDGSEVIVSPFFAAVSVPVSGGTPKPAAASGTMSGNPVPELWLLAEPDGHAQLTNSDGAAIADIGGLGSELVGLQTGCRGGWQILASGTGDYGEPDTLQAYEIVNHKAVEASVPVDFEGPVLALWPLPNGSEAMAITQNLKTAEYEAYRVSISCGQ